MITCEKTRLDGVLLFRMDAFEDHRGVYVETYNEQLYREHGVEAVFVQDDISVSSRHVLRGIHGDANTTKLISCLHGRFYLVVVNSDPDSAQYLKWDSFVLSDSNHLQVLVPPKFGNGHLVLSDTAMFHYKQDTYYDPKSQFTYRWDDPRVGIWWPIKDPILSRRDEAGHFVED